MSAPTLSIEGIQVYRGWDYRIPGNPDEDEEFQLYPQRDNVIYWGTPTEAGVTHVEVWAINYTTGAPYLLATVATNVVQVAYDYDIYLKLRTGEFQTYTLRAKNAEGFGPWSSAPRLPKKWDGNPNHPEDRNEIGNITALEVVSGTNVKITWENPANSSNGVFQNTGVIVYRSIEGGNFVPISVIAAGTFSYTDTNVDSLIQSGDVALYRIAIKDLKSQISPTFTSNIVSYVKAAEVTVPDGIDFLTGFFSGSPVRFKLNWSFSKLLTGTVFTVQRARPNPSGNTDRMTWNTYASIAMAQAYVSDYIDSSHGIYEYTYNDDTSSQWAFRVKATTTTGTEYFSAPFFLAPAAPSLVVNHIYQQVYSFQVGHPSFAQTNVQAYYYTLKAYKSVNGGAFTLLWTATNVTINPNIPNWRYLPSGGFATNGIWSTSTLLPSPESELTQLDRFIYAGIPEGTIQFKAVISATDNFDGLKSEVISPVYSFDQLN